MTAFLKLVVLAICRYLFDTVDGQSMAIPLGTSWDMEEPLYECRDTPPTNRQRVLSIYNRTSSKVKRVVSASKSHVTLNLGALFRRSPLFFVPLVPHPQDPCLFRGFPKQNISSKPWSTSNSKRRCIYIYIYIHIW